jgi:hypothetical protein
MAPITERGAPQRRVPGTSPELLPPLTTFAISELFIEFKVPELGLRFGSPSSMT